LCSASFCCRCADVYRRFMFDEEFDPGVQAAHVCLGKADMTTPRR
jgi:hypothetical protein